MILVLAAAIAASTPLPPKSLLDEAQHAIEVHRLEEARLILASAAKAGESGPRLDRLLADLSFEDGKYADAERRYIALLKIDLGDSAVAERGGLAALHLGHVNVASSLIEIAIRSPGASWRAWNAKGVLCDINHDWKCADRAYDTAARLAPGEAVVLNNEGWSHVLRGDWPGALPLLEQAARLDPKSEKAADNLQLARDALSHDLPTREPNETGAEFAARLNDAGVVAERQGDHARAVAAFSQALVASDTWDARAANNLEEARQQ